MFRERDHQANLFEPSRLYGAAKRGRLERTWAATFRRSALPLIVEAPFADLYCEDNGAPNKAVQVVLGVLLLKELFDLTDMQALEQLEFNELWHHALRLLPDEAHACQKTLHNMRARLLGTDGGRLAFETITDGVLRALGTNTKRQRLDSTHVVSNIARLTRLGLFCETLRVFLKAVRKTHRRLFKRLPDGLRRRYLRDEGDDTHFEDSTSSDSQRRLAVCARDVYRVIALYRSTQAARLEQFGVLERLFAEQCELSESAESPEESDEDRGDGDAPVVVKEPQRIASDSLQTPHDPDVTYSGHKGKGYEVQIAETCDDANATEIITEVAVTPASQSDASSMVPILDALSNRGHQPDELIADTTYGSVANVIEAAQRGTELVAPVPGSAPAEDAPQRAVAAADFDIDPGLARPALCPADVEAVRQIREPDSDRVELHFPASACAGCPLARLCPTQRVGDVRVLRLRLEPTIREQRRRYQQTDAFKDRYRMRAGCEATNSDLKRSHGLGRLRVRGRLRVQLAVYLKAAACNLRRLIRALTSPRRAPHAAAA